MLRRIGRSLAYRLKAFLRRKRTPLYNLYGRKVVAAREGFALGAVVMVDGGLGSQMWQYALGLGVEKFTGLPVSYDLGWYRFAGMDIHEKNNRNFELTNVFPSLPLREARPEMSALYRKFFFCRQKSYFSPEGWVYGEKRRPKYYGGYYSCALYIDALGDELRDLFTFALPMNEANEKTRAAIERSSCAVAVHVRRGDYVGSIHDVVGPGYYRNAVSLVASRAVKKTNAASPMPETCETREASEIRETRKTYRKPVFFVFSNDIPYARELFAGNEAGEFVFVDHNDNDGGAYDMYLMSLCRHHIIANSGFSWWPAWLNRRPDKIVVMPEQWIAETAETAGQETAMRVRGWIPLPNRTEEIE